MNPEQVVREYIHRINAADVEGLLALMTADHVFYIEGGAPLSGTEAMREAWKGYYAAYPTYHIYIDQVYDQQKTVIVLGHTSGSHVAASIESQPSSVLWEARLRDGLIAAWIIYYPVTPETRKRFHLS